MAGPGGQHNGGAVRRELTRRGLLAAAGGGALSLAALAGPLRALTAAAQAAGPLPLSPGDPQVRATMAAFADTIVPGPAGGADPDPGAVEANTLNEIYLPFYGATPVFPMLHQDLQLATPRVLGRFAAFDLALPYPDRERVVIERMTATGAGGDDLNNYVLYEGLAVLIYVTYFGTAQSQVGPRYAGFPSQSDGYWPHHTYRVRFAGMTSDGNPD